MKRLTFLMLLMAFVYLFAPGITFAQDPTTTVVNVQKLKTKWPDNGSASTRDSLIAIYNANVVNKNEHILSHREYGHFFTGDNHDYLVIEEYKDLAGMEAAFLRTTELENQAWPDKMKREAFFDSLEAYFENWHGDALYRLNPKLSKN